MNTPSSDRRLPALLLALTVVTGIVDAVSYLAFGHVFTANMTGNVVFLGFAMAHVPGLSIARSAAALGAFAIGATMGIRNATVRKLSERDLTTTVLTLTITGLAADSSLANGGNPGWTRRAASVVLMFAGAGVGAWLLRYSVALPVAVAGAVSALCALGARRAT